MTRLKQLTTFVAGVLLGGTTIVPFWYQERAEKEEIARDIDFLQFHYNYTRDGMQGFHSTESPLVGVNSEVNRTFQEYVPNHHALVRLHKAVRMGDERYTFIPMEEAEHARVIATRKLEEYLQQYDPVDSDTRNQFANRLSPKNAVDYCSTKYSDWCSSRVRTAREPTWHVHAMVDRDEMEVTYDGVDYIVLKEVAALHELEHVKRKAKDDTPDIEGYEYGSVVGELSPTLTEVVLNYQIAKELGLPESNAPLETDYGVLTINELAEELERLSLQYGSMEEVLMSPEGEAFVSQFYSNEQLEDPLQYVLVEASD